MGISIIMPEDDGCNHLPSELLQLDDVKDSSNLSSSEPEKRAPKKVQPDPKGTPKEKVVTDYPPPDDHQKPLCSEGIPLLPSEESKVVEDLSTDKYTCSQQLPAVKKSLNTLVSYMLYY